MSEYVIPVPGKFVERVAFLDIETEKVPTPDGYVMPNGEPLRRRWSVTLSAVARDGYLTLIDGEGDERMALRKTGDWLHMADEVRYWATREFDEMVLRGRMTNARRSHLPKPTWPAMPGAERVRWVNARREELKTSWRDLYGRRDGDLPSKDVPSVLRNGGEEGWMRCAVHVLRDALSIVLVDGEPNARCRRWSERFVMDYAFAVRVLTADDGLAMSDLEERLYWM
jgi:hypothetical protein